MRFVTSLRTELATRTESYLNTGQTLRVTIERKVKSVMRPYVLECLSLASRLGHLVARHDRDYACTCTCSPCRWYVVLLKLGFVCGSGTETRPLENSGLAEFLNQADIESEGLD
jgi:hypothetical protein